MVLVLSSSAKILIPVAGYTLLHLEQFKFTLTCTSELEITFTYPLTNRIFEEELIGLDPFLYSVFF